jgi:hypothetical protein
MVQDDTFFLESTRVLFFFLSTLWCRTFSEYNEKIDYVMLENSEYTVYEYLQHFRDTDRFMHQRRKATLDTINMHL